MMIIQSWFDTKSGLTAYFARKILLYITALLNIILLQFQYSRYQQSALTGRILPLQLYTWTICLFTFYTQNTLKILLPFVFSIEYNNTARFLF